MARSRRLRTFTALVVAPVTFLSMALLAAGPVQAAGGPSGSRTGSSESVNAATSGSHRAQLDQHADKKTDHNAHKKADQKVDKQQKAAQGHYTNAPCNTVEKNYLKRDFARCFAVVRTALDHQIKADPNAPPPTALGPADIQAAYNLPATGQGQTVAVVDAFGNSHAEADLAVFRAEFGLPPCTTANGCFRKIDQNGGTDYPPDDPGWGLETSLDLDAVSAACPSCNILLVQGDDNSLDSLGTAVDTAVAEGAKYVSNSYGVPGEDPSELDYDHYYSHEGVAVTASSGDTGNVTNWPATNPDVIAVGGTTLSEDSSTRGWSETAWADGGSGCSPYEPKPDYQDDVATECDNRAIADISAVGDPETGLAVYDTLGFDGWLQVGGTSLSAPLVASMYALAGTPVPGTFPVNYPYDAPGGLFDITEGTNGGCGDVLCEAGPGWDGPTGLGTPNGVSSLTTGPHGDVAGDVTDAGTGDPIEGATVSTPDGFSDTTDASGAYDISLPTGTYDVTASAFGFDSGTQTGVTVTEGQTTTADFALDAVPSRTVSGTVADGSGQGWPLYAKITVDGQPGGPLFTNPYTGRYSLDLPVGTYTMHVAPVYPGYETTDVTVTVGASDVQQNVDVPVDASSCIAPGYAYAYDGTSQAFTGWTGTTAQDGWSIVDNKANGETWVFDNPGNRAPPPGSDGDLAIIDSDKYGSGHSQDSSLVTPIVDLSVQDSPEIGFDTFYNGISGQVGDVDLSIDGGATWTNLWHQTTTDVTGHIDLEIPQAAGQSDVQVRFHFTGTFGWWWQLDNVFVGNRTCDPTHAGLVAGIVKDNNTNAPINGAKVQSVDNPDDMGISAATPDDANLGDGFYWLLSSLTGSHKFIASSGNYTPVTQNVDVAPAFMTRKNWTLKAGHLTVSGGSISGTMRMGQQRTGQVTFGNDGTSPVHVNLSEQDAGFDPMAQGSVEGAPLQHIKGNFTTKAMVLQAHKGSQQKGETQLRSTRPFAAPWTDIADFPTAVMDNAVAANDGLVYSVAGFNGLDNVADGFVYDASSQAWSPIADAPEPLESPAAAFVNGTMYLVGGWGASGDATSSVYAYDPGGDSWSQVADLPKSVSAASVASLGGSLYVVGGCTTGNCLPASKAAYRYDPAADSWTQLADFPSPVAFMACAGIAGELVCAGGVNADTNVTSKSTYIYDPGSDSWTKMADIPYDVWAMSYSGANEKLQIAAGVTSNSAVVTNQAAEYDPASDSWATLPNANNAEYRGGGACGMYKIGGSTGGFAPTKFAEVLPGYDQCGGGGADVPWISEDNTEFDVAPGETVTVTVTMDSSMVSQPGDYLGALAVGTDSPYSVQPVDVAMHVNPPASWGKIRGTVTNAANGAPLAGVTVQICTMYDKTSGNCGPVTYTLKTDNAGYYQLWLNKGYSPLEVIAAKDGYQPQVKISKITAGGTTTANFALRKN